MRLDSQQKILLQDFYLAMRNLSKSGIPRRGLQRSFEEMVYSIMGKDAWLPSHITKNALVQYTSGNDTRLQRAHGSFSDRLDRYVRTLQIIEGEEQTFDEWWKFFIYHDKTILMTRKEHGSKKKFENIDVVSIPRDDNRYFENSGFSAKIRKSVEVLWMMSEVKKLDNLILNC